MQNLTKNNSKSSDKLGNATSTARRTRYFYGWNIVAASFLAQLAYAEHYTSVLGLFIKPLQNEFGWSRSAISAVQTIARGLKRLLRP